MVEACRDSLSSIYIGYNVANVTGANDCPDTCSVITCGILLALVIIFLPSKPLYNHLVQI